jgi:hypothetical protein
MWRGGNRELIELGRRAVADLGLLPSEPQS